MDLFDALVSLGVLNNCTVPSVDIYIYIYIYIEENGPQIDFRKRTWVLERI